MSTGWIYLIGSSAGTLFGLAVNRRDRLSVGLGVATGVAFCFAAIYHSAWPTLPASLLGIWTWTRRSGSGRG